MGEVAKRLERKTAFDSITFYHTPLMVHNLVYVPHHVMIWWVYETDLDILWISIYDFIRKHTFQNILSFDHPIYSTASGESLYSGSRLLVALGQKTQYLEFAL